MSRRHPHLLWSPHERDTFAIGSSDGQHLKLYRFDGDGADGASGDPRSMRLIGGVADAQLKCMAWCPHAVNPWTFAVGTTSGRLVLHDLTPDVGAGSRTTTAVCEFVPRVGPRVCFSAAWNPLQPLQVAAGLDKVRGAFGVLVWDVNRAAAASAASPAVPTGAEYAGGGQLGAGGGGGSLGGLPGQALPLPSARGARCGAPDFSSCVSFDLSAMGAVPTIDEPIGQLGNSEQVIPSDCL